MFPFESWSISLVSALLVGVPVSIIILVYAYLKIRPKFPVRVNCWFCLKNSDVPYDNRNCWDCPHCEQYNGFSADGGYNKLIPAQHDELLNHSVSAKSSLNKKNPPVSSKNPLCRKCTINQDLKIQQLASFTPRDPTFFDEEVEEYRQHLERAYQLCEACELVVKQTLHHQQGWLLDQHRKHLLMLRSQATQRVLAWWQRGLPVIWLQRAQVLSTVVATGLLMSHCHKMFASHFSQFISPDIAYIMEITPNYEHIVASIITCALIIVTGCCSSLRPLDIITGVFWFIMFCHNWLLLWPYFKNNVTELDLNMGHSVVIGLTFLVNLLAAVTSRRVFPTKNLLVKISKQDDGRVYRGRNITEHFNSPAAVPVTGESNKQSSPSALDASIPSRPSSPRPTIIESGRYSPLQPSAFRSSVSAQDSDSPSGELEWGLGKLSLGPSNTRNRNNCSVFRTKPYGVGEGMSAFHSTCHKTENAEHPISKTHPPFLKPSKLNIRRNVTQTSWVAGGYWRELGGTLSKAVQSGRNLFETSIQSPEGFSPISRTSSQSSGFHSHSSNSPASSPNSWNGSMCGGDVDHFSVLSESVSPTVACRCGVNEQTSTLAAKPQFMSVPYYGSFPVCVPHICPLNMAAPPPGAFGPRSMPWMINQQCFPVPKQYLPGSYFLSAFPQPPAKSFSLSPLPLADAVSRSGSSLHSSGHASVAKPVKNNIQNMWHIVKQNILLSILCIGSVLVNVVGMVVLIYKNRSVLQL